MDFLFVWRDLFFGPITGVIFPFVSVVHNHTDVPLALEHLKSIIQNPNKQTVTTIHTRHGSNRNKRAISQTHLTQNENRKNEAANQQPNRHERNEKKKREAAQEMDRSLGAHAR